MGLVPRDLPMKESGYCPSYLQVLWSQPAWQPRHIQSLGLVSTMRIPKKMTKPHVLEWPQTDKTHIEQMVASSE